MKEGYGRTALIYSFFPREESLSLWFSYVAGSGIEAQYVYKPKRKKKLFFLQ
jgi:hypothetical protein